MTRRLLVEGWRAIHHSYALIAQAHCLCLLRRPGIDLRFRDLPYHSDAWRPTIGLFDRDDEARLAGVPAPESAFDPDTTFSMHPERPDFSPPSTGRKFVFGTPEHRVLPPASVIGAGAASDLAPSIEIVTPSHWTAVAYERFGFGRERIHVVPHGIDPALVHPDPASRGAVRTALGIDDDFAFMSIGAMTPNKGIGLLLAAFSAVTERHPAVRLVLKGADALYPSRDFLKAALDTLSASARDAVVNRLVYHGSTFSTRRMAAFLRAADCYVAPYLAEGFNLPVLESAGSGTAVICTAGGPTDDFTTDAFAARLSSRIMQSTRADGRVEEALAPDYDDLVETMRAAAADPDLTRSRGAAGARYVGEHFTWERVTDMLVDAFTASEGPGR
ncbi:MAG: glycosyltransferase family 4 protein [Casimicrobiaceae bacterium]